MKGMIWKKMSNVFCLTMVLMVVFSGIAGNLVRGEEATACKDSVLEDPVCTAQSQEEESWSGLFASSADSEPYDSMLSDGFEDADGEEGALSDGFEVENGEEGALSDGSEFTNGEDGVLSDGSEGADGEGGVLSDGAEEGNVSGLFSDVEDGSQEQNVEIPDAVFDSDEDSETERTDLEETVPDDAKTETEMLPEEDAPEEMIVADEALEEEIETEEESALLQAAASGGGAGEISGTTGRNGTILQWTLKDGVLTVSGKGKMDDFYTSVDYFTGKVLESFEPEWKPYAGQIKEVVIQSGVTVVGERAFESLSNLKKVTIASSVKEIRMYAFCNDGRLTEIHLSEGLEKLRTNAFYYAGVEELKLPKSLKMLDSYALNGLFSLKNYRMDGAGTYMVRDGVLYKDGGTTLAAFPVGRTGSYTVPGNVRKIGAEAFFSGNVSEIILPKTLEEIGEQAFGRTKVREMTIPGSIKKVPAYLFWDATELRKVTLGEGITEIGNCAFNSAQKLEQVSLPKTLKTIGDYAFGCCAIDTIRIPASVTSIGQNALEGIKNIVLEGDNLIRLEDGSYIMGSIIKVAAYEDYDGAFRILDLTNKERSKAGLKPLTMDASLLETAMLRSYETILLFSHDRPNGLGCFSANNLIEGENIARNSSPEAAFKSWMNSEGHKNNILGSRFQTIGIGCVRLGNRYYCVQCFGSQLSGQASRSNYSNRNKTRAVIYDAQKYSDLKNALKNAQKNGNGSSSIMDSKGAKDRNNGTLNTVSSKTKGSSNNKTGKTTISKAPTGVKVKMNKKGKITVRWKKLRKSNKKLWKTVHRIEVQYSTDRSFRKNVVSKNVGKKKAKLQIKGLKKKTVYYVRIRYLDKNGGHSKWSNTKKVKTRAK